jgi:hypothetical protein
MRESASLHAALSCHILILLPLCRLAALDVSLLLLLGHATAAAKVAVSPMLSRLPSASQHVSTLA